MTNHHSNQDEKTLLALGLDPPSFLDDAFNAVDEYLADSVDALESALLESYSPQQIHQKEETVKAVDEIYDLLSEALDKYWLKFEEFAQRNCFRIPQGFIVPDESPSISASVTENILAEEEKLDSELLFLVQQIEEEKVELAQVRREARNLDMEVQRHRRPAEVLRALAEQASGNGGLVEATFQLQELMERAAALRAHKQSQNQPLEGNATISPDGSRQNV